MSAPYITNAEITDAILGFDRGFILSCHLQLAFNGFSQGFGGFVLGGSPFDESAVCARHMDQRNLAADFIGGVFAVAGVTLFSDLKGKIIRIRKDDEWSPIRAIGHPVRDLWYDPTERLSALTSEGGE